MDCFKIILNRGGIIGSRSFHEFKIQYQQVMKTRKDNCLNFINDYVPYLPWKHKLEKQIFPSSGYPIYYHHHHHHYYYYYHYHYIDTYIPSMGWKMADKICVKYYYNEIMFLTHLHIAKVYTISNNNSNNNNNNNGNDNGTQILKHLGTFSNKTSLLMDLLSIKLREYLDMSFSES